MATFVYAQSTLGITVPAGRYTAKFLGTEDREPMDGSKYGKGLVPRMAWIFEVVEGDRKGERIGQETGVSAIPKSGCARVILGLSGGQIQPGQRVDTDTFVGKVYSVKVAVNPDSDKGNLHIADIEPVTQQSSAPRPASTTAAAAPPRPPRPPAPPKPATAEKYWMDRGADEPILADRVEIQTHIANTKLDPTKVLLCPEGKDEYRPAAEFGFKETVPW